MFPSRLLVIRLDPVALFSICVIALCVGLVAGVLAAHSETPPSGEAGMRGVPAVPAVADEPQLTPCEAILEWQGACPPFRIA